jgi:hypothetical protein
MKNILSLKFNEDTYLEGRYKVNKNAKETYLFAKLNYDNVYNSFFVGIVERCVEKQELMWRIFLARFKKQQETHPVIDLTDKVKEIGGGFISSCRLEIVPVAKLVSNIILIELSEDNK